jgi:hypothetical protein
VYNGRVAEYHTYFVGDEGWGFSLWAHNSYAPNSGVPPRSGPLFQNPSQVVTTWVGELRSAIPTAQRGRITMAVAVVEDSNGVRSILVSSSEGAYVRGAVRPVVESMGAQVVGGTGHAEANIIAHAQANNLRVIDMEQQGRSACLARMLSIRPELTSRRLCDLDRATENW